MAPVETRPIREVPKDYDSDDEVMKAPVPAPPRPPRPVKVPGYVFTAPTTVEANAWLQRQVFHTHDRTVMQSVRHQQPVFLWDAQAKQLHGVFQRTHDQQQLQEDLTKPPGPQGYQLRIKPLYVFPVTLSWAVVEDLLISQRRQQMPTPDTAQQPALQDSQPSFEPVLGSFQHGALWEAFSKAAKRQQQIAQAPQNGQPPPPPPRLQPQPQ